VYGRFGGFLERDCFVAALLAMTRSCVALL
jgi:hypothetical protein